eukprot:Clim_evm18s197 gene=Clim_evmTU18s197
MNVSSLDDGSQFLFANFNQDYSCVSVGTSTGYHIYNCDPFNKGYTKECGDTGIIEMLFCTSLVAQVGGGHKVDRSPRVLQVANTKRNTVICQLNFSNTILCVKLNRKRLIVVLEDKIYIYDINTMNLLHTLQTTLNKAGIVALSPDQDNNFLAYPANANTGELLIFDVRSIQAVNVLQAHKSPVRCIAFNQSGTMIATASDKGTIIRIFSVPDSKKLFQFRRGTKPATIYSIAFSVTGKFLCVSSDTDTIHIFKIEDGSGGSGVSEGSAIKKVSPNQNYLGLGNTTEYLSSYLPEMLTEIWEPVRHFAHVKLPKTGLKSICAISNSSPTVMVITNEGYFYTYALDSQEGGECQLLRQYSLLQSQPASIVEDEQVGDKISF